MSGQQGYFIEDLEVGMAATHSKEITNGDIVAFAEVSGDNNPIHLDDEYAASTMFGERIAHGMLSASLLSTVLGTMLPGPGSIYLSQTLKFKAAVRIGDTVDATATVAQLDTNRRRATLSCSCTVGDVVVVDGEAIIMVPSRAA